MAKKKSDNLPNANDPVAIKVVTHAPAEAPGKIAMILKLYSEGYTVDQIVAKGYNATTVRIQCARIDKQKKSNPPV